jgi:hypothetical protein
MNPWTVRIDYGRAKLAFGLPQHADEHRPERPILLAVDQELGEGAGLGVAVAGADRIGADLDGTGIALIMRAMDEGPGETARPQVPVSAAPSEASNLSAITSLFLGILAFVIRLVAGVDWVMQKKESKTRSR